MHDTGQKLVPSGLACSPVNKEVSTIRRPQTHACKRPARSNSPVERATRGRGAQWGQHRTTAAVWRAGLFNGRGAGTTVTGGAAARLAGGVAALPAPVPWPPWQPACPLSAHAATCSNCQECLCSRCMETSAHTTGIAPGVAPSPLQQAAVAAQEPRRAARLPRLWRRGVQRHQGWRRRPPRARQARGSSWRGASRPPARWGPARGPDPAAAARAASAAAPAPHANAALIRTSTCDIVGRPQQSGSRQGMSMQAGGDIG